MNGFTFVLSTGLFGYTTFLCAQADQVITWDPTTLSVHLYPGTGKSAVVRLTSTTALQPLKLIPSESVAPLVLELAVASSSAGISLDLSVTFAASLKQEPGEFIGELRPQITFVRADSNGNGAVDISDAIFTLGFLFTIGSPPTCRDGADANDDGAVERARLRAHTVFPDAFFSLLRLDPEDGATKAWHYLLELDRSTENHDRFVRKLRNYAQWRAFTRHTLVAQPDRHFVFKLGARLAISLMSADVPPLDVHPSEVEAFKRKVYAASARPTAEVLRELDGRVAGCGCSQVMLCSSANWPVPQRTSTSPTGYQTRSGL